MMATYRVKVFETHEEAMWYTVELDEEELRSAIADGLTAEQAALDKAENGDTVAEEKISWVGIVDREADADTLERLEE
jgi:hypothetical protein